MSVVVRTPEQEALTREQAAKMIAEVLQTLEVSSGRTVESLRIAHEPSNGSDDVIRRYVVIEFYAREEWAT